MPRAQDADADTVPASDGGGSRESEPPRIRRGTGSDVAPSRAMRYELGAELGCGGMGRVVEALDVQLGRTVALKEVLPNRGAAIVARFEREVRITARLEHPSIVPLYDSGHMPDGRPFYVMRRVSGRPLDALIGGARSLPERLALLPNMLAAIDAVGHAHRRGIVHRDLKPANILIGDAGETVVIDWGLAKVLGEDDDDLAIGDEQESAAGGVETQAGSVFGTPGFMAPEQARGEALGTRADVFALGATLYQLLAGRSPMAGDSATGLIASTIARRITPIGVAAPTAPAELQAIVEKALAFESAARYPDAERLAEDLRRFLTGQLVAAHSYTTRERIARFMRKHRAPLSVAALALVAGAALAGVGVHRVLIERDIATEASRDAERERNRALTANVELVDRADGLVIAQARAILDTNPTAALATLKELKSTSSRSAEARGVAIAAAARGVPWALQTTGAPRSLELDRDARRLAEIATDGVLHVWDLDTRRELVSQHMDTWAPPLWLGDGRLLLVDGPDRKAVILDVQRKVTHVLPVGPVDDVGGDAAGMHVAAIDAQQRAEVIDIATGKPTTYWDGHAAHAVKLAPDGTSLAIADAGATVIVDVATGAVTYTRPREVAMLATTPGRFAGFGATDGMPVELARGPDGAWRDVPLPLPPTSHAYGLAYRGGRLEVFTSDGVLRFGGREVGHRALAAMMPATQVARGTTVVQTLSGTLAFYNDDASGTLQLPIPLVEPRIAGRPEHTRLVVAAAGLVLVYDLADILPTFVPKTGNLDTAFVDHDTLLMWPDRDRGYSWWDIATSRRTELASDIGPVAELFDRDPVDGRALLFDRRGNDSGRLVIVRKDQRAIESVVDGDATLRGVLVPDGALYAQTGDPRVLVRERGGPPRELTEVAGGVLGLHMIDRRHFAALGGRGELVRGPLEGGALERTHVDVGPGATVTANRDGDVVVANGTQLSIWPTGDAVRAFATLPHQIVAVVASGVGLIASLDDGSVHYVDARGAAHELASVSGRNVSVGIDGAWVAGGGTSGTVTAVELPSLARWSLPQLFSTPTGFPLVQVAPGGRRLMECGFGGYELFDPPEPGGDLGAWLDERTNAVASPDGALSWR